MSLTDKKCIPCEVGGIPLGKEEASSYLKEIPEWKIHADSKKIFRTFTFKDFKEAMSFINKVAGLAESEGHHPDIIINYNKVTLELTTHAMGGLSENDFIVAAKINGLA